MKHVSLFALLVTTIENQTTQAFQNQHITNFPNNLKSYHVNSIFISSDTIRKERKKSKMLQKFAFRRQKMEQVYKRTTLFIATESNENQLEIDIPMFPDHLSNNLDNDEIRDINEITNMLFDTKSHPVGSLSVEALYSTHFIMDRWAKCGMGAKGAILVQQILQRVLDEQKAGNRIADEIISSKLYTVAIDAWARSNSPDAPQHALNILQQERNAHTITENTMLKPNAVSYNAVLKSFAKAGSATEAEELLNLMTTFEDEDAKPNVISYNAVLDAYARSAHDDHTAAEKAEEILRKMRETCNKKYGVTPDLISFNTVIDAYAKSGNPKKAENILKLMEGDGVQPDEVSNSSLIHAWARSGLPESADRALSILDEMEKKNRLSSTKNGLDLMSWNAVLDCLAKNGKAKDAERLLGRMEMEEGIQPNTVSYNTVINSISKSNDKNAAEHSLEVLERMEKLHKEGNDSSIKPDVFSYTTVINALSRSKKPGAPQKAEELLEKMVRISYEGDENVFPNTVTINSVISAYAKSTEKGAAERAEQILIRMENLYKKGDDRLKPNTISYTTVIDSYAKSEDKGSYKKAQIIFSKMEDMYAGGNMDAKPNVHSYNTLLNAVARENSPKAAQLAEQILRRMEDAYEKKGDNVARPNVVSYTTVMTAMVRSGANDAAEKVEELLDRMEKMSENGNTCAIPNSFTYSVVIDAYVKKGDLTSVESANRILERMEAAFRDGNKDAKPNIINYTTMIDAWSKSGIPKCGEKAAKVLEQLENMNAEFGDSFDFKPNAYTFNACINAWAKSRSFEKAHEAKSILDRMIELHKTGNKNVKPNVFTFTSVLNACAYAVGDQHAKQASLLIAAETYKQLAAPPHKFGKPNHITYATFLKACRNLIPADTEARESSVNTVFKKCCDDGQVNDLVLRELKSAVVSKDQLQKLLGGLGEDASISDIPSSWKSNVNEVTRKVRRPRKK